MKLTLKEIAQRTGGVLHGSDMTVYGLETDSRNVKSGCIFAAIKGSRADGFDFIEELDKADNIAYLTDRAPENARNPYIIVKDVVRAVGSVAALHLEKIPAKKIAVTGSVGKTTTKNFIAAALSECMSVHFSKGNRNNELGLPLSALGASESDDAVVLEMGMRGFHEIEYLCSIAPPDIAVITNIGISHIELLGSRENILKAKSEITDALRPDGVAVLNGDDDMLQTLKTDKKTLRFGIENENCDIRALNIVNNSFDMLVGGIKYHVTLSVAGRHNIYNALAAVAVGTALGLPAEKLIRGTQSFSGDGKRQNIYQFHGLRIFDDTYNASPASMRAAMEVMRGYDGRRVLVLADMLELGEYSKDAHVSLADDIRSLGAGLVICIGREMLHLYNALDGVRRFHCTDNGQALKILMQNAMPGDNILFKGSQSMNMAGLLNDFRGEWVK